MIKTMPPIRCDSCGKFRSYKDVKVEEHGNWDQTDVEWSSWCRWCMPTMFIDKEEQS